MFHRVALASLALGSALILSSAADAQPYPYGPPRYGGDGYSNPQQPRSRVIEDYPAQGPRHAPGYRRVEEYPNSRRERGRAGRGPWDCNESRCINMATGDLWESTCSYGGCSPLRPARRNAW